MQKKKLSFWQIWNMSFGFLGIQFGFALQGGFMSRIFQTLGSNKEDIPILWIAAPLTGLLVQPIIGYFSDRTWHPKLGRRRPYFLWGAILSSITLLFVPHSPTLWIAAGCLWVLDASINISMEPFRALVADKLNEEQRSYGFVVQTLIIGIGTWIASNLPWLVNQVGVSNEAAPGIVPMSVKVAFAIGALIFISSILYTIFTTSEEPPEDMEAFLKEKEKGHFGFGGEILSKIIGMPKVMKKLGVVQFFSWFAFFTMWSMATPSLTEYIFNAPSPNNPKNTGAVENISVNGSPKKDFYTITLNTGAKIVVDNEVMHQPEIASESAIVTGGILSTDQIMEEIKEHCDFRSQNHAYNNASDKVGSAMGMYGLSSMVFALLLTFYAARKKINRKNVHLFSLIAGGLGFIFMFVFKTESSMTIGFILVGISWGSILSMPYAMLSGAIDEKQMGIYMGIFNMFIVIPQIIAAIGGINLLSKIFGSGAMNSMLLAGACLIIAGLANLLITEKEVIS
ncbi:MAG: MFS transporter [Crocinitomicaceae bacterium]